VVVVCESCSTRFQLAEARIPPRGTLVRCSRCKATFIVKPPSASFEETVQDVVAEVTEAGGSPPPEPAEDLFDKGGDELGQTRRGGDEEAWEFDESPAEKPPGPALALAAPPGPLEPSALSTSALPPLEEIGSPEEWDLLGDSVAAAASAAKFVEPEPPPQPAPAEPLRTPAPAPRRSEPRPVQPERRSAASRVAHAVSQAARAVLRTSAWLALAGLVSSGVVQLVPRGPALGVPAAAASEDVALSDGEARGVRVRFVENAFAGTLYVVQGELARTSADPALGLRVHWLDERGVRVGTAAWARPVPPPGELRERAPAALAAGAAPAPQQGPFVAIFDAIPAAATGVGLALEPLPASPASAPPAVPAPPSEGAASAGPGPAAATASSPPSPRPSSE